MIKMFWQNKTKGNRGDVRVKSCNIQWKTTSKTCGMAKNQNFVFFAENSSQFFAEV